MWTLIKNNPILSRYAYRFINYRIAQKQYRDNKRLLEQIKRYKDIHKGKRCFIIGTGPSLNITDLEALGSEVTFGTNRIYELFNKTLWRPTYYINQDHNLIKTFRDKIESIECQIKFLPVDYKEDFSHHNTLFFVLKHKEFYPHKAPFSFDLSKYMAQGFTVTYGAIQIAAYMGFKEIYLIGVDHNYNISRDAKGNIIMNNSENHNYPEGMKEFINKGNLPRVAETTIAYETAEEVSRKIGFRIYNATRGGKLEAFERVDLDQILQK